MMDANCDFKEATGASVTHYSNQTGYWGHPLRNEFLDLYEDSFTENDWVYFLDDDNVLHPKFIQQLESLLYLNAGIVTWGQEGRLRPTNEPRVGNIDTASFMFRPSQIKGLRFNTAYDADGTFANAAAGLTDLICVEAYLCYYNALR
jgi:hypothetical protein